jgi:hypothetical protein
MKMNRFIMVCAAICSLMLIIPLAARAVPTIERTWAFIDNRPGDDIFVTGLRLNLTVLATDTLGSDALKFGSASVDSSNSSPPYSPDPRPVPLNAVYPIISGAEFTTLPPITTSDFTKVIGNYTFTVTNSSSQTATSISHTLNLDKLEIIPFPTGLATNDHSTTPIFTFIDPDSSPNVPNVERWYQFEIFDASTPDEVNIYQSEVKQTIDFLPVPNGILQWGGTYYFRALSLDVDLDDPANPVNRRVENRAISYLPFQTAIPEPSTMLLIGSGLIGLAGYGRRKFFKK